MNDDIKKKYLGERNPLAPWIEPGEELAVDEAVEVEPVEEKTKPLPKLGVLAATLNLPKTKKK